MTATSPFIVHAPGLADQLGDPDLVLVVSDLHLGNGQDPDSGRYHRRENFLSDAGFEDFLEHHASAIHGSSLLVLNGDIFDFLRITDVPTTDADFAEWSALLADLRMPSLPTASMLRQVIRRERRYGLRTSDYKSVWKLRCIANGHRRFFRALNWWIEAGHQLVLVKGNHDVELYWPLVQAAIRWEIAGRTLSADVDGRVFFCQDGFQLANVYFEHGHRFEGTTTVKGPPTLPGVPTELNLPLGSFVNRYVINDLEEIDPFLDNVRPLNQVLWNMFQAHPFRIPQIAWRAIPFLRRTLRPYWLRDGLAFYVYFGTAAGAVIGMLLLATGIAALLSPAAAKVVLSTAPVVRTVIGAVLSVLPWVLGLLRDIIPQRRPPNGEDAYSSGIYEKLAGLQFGRSYSRIYGTVGHTHVPDVQRLRDIGGAEALYLNSGTWTANWGPDRPDLEGRIVYSFLRFSRSPEGGYLHEHLEWQPTSCTVSESIVPRPDSRPRLRRR